MFLFHLFLRRYVGSFKLGSRKDCYMLFPNNGELELLGEGQLKGKAFAEQTRRGVMFLSARKQLFVHRYTAAKPIKVQLKDRDADWLKSQYGGFKDTPHRLKVFINHLLQQAGSEFRLTSFTRSPDGQSFLFSLKVIL